MASLSCSQWAPASVAPIETRSYNGVGMITSIARLAFVECQLLYDLWYHPTHDKISHGHHLPSYSSISYFF
jgi:hypothetical protein